MKAQVAIVEIKSILWKVIGLIDQVKITVLHSSGTVAGMVCDNRLGQKYKIRLWSGKIILQPLFPLKINDLRHSHHDHKPPERRVSPLHLILRHVREIHSIYTGDKRQGDENGCHNSKYFHHTGHSEGHF